MSNVHLARQKILEGLRIDMDGELPELPKESFWLGNSDQLTRDQIFTALNAFALTLDLTSCNSGGRNLYELLCLYLQNPEARAQFNVIVKAHGWEINGSE